VSCGFLQTSTQFYGALWCLSYVIYAVGNLIGVSVGSKSQITATVCVIILFWCTNGLTLMVGHQSRGKMHHALSQQVLGSKVDSVFCLWHVCSHRIW
jgi:hypothetical protein